MVLNLNRVLSKLSLFSYTITNISFGQYLLTGLSVFYKLD
ncbi:hypothetical protein PPAR_a0432 [Pseudoalteromonas paragorgicola KMM 3548]|nr:hypothetical protein [Pseudoalteromonas distincta KMM 3548]